MRPTELLQEIRKMRFEESFSIWTEGRITQEEAARMLNVSSRTFRRYVDRYHNNGISAFLMKQLDLPEQSQTVRRVFDEKKASSL